MHCPIALRLQIRVLVRHAADRRPDVTDKLSVTLHAYKVQKPYILYSTHAYECHNGVTTREYEYLRIAIVVADLLS